jgi:CheY-like chemotaxis protein
VLVVNEDRDALATLGAILEEHGVRVRLAASRADAWRAVRSGFQPDVVLLDLAGWDERGERFVGRLRADPRLADAALVAISRSPDRLRRLDGDVDGALEKPFSLGRLFELLTELCGH